MFWPADPPPPSAPPLDPDDDVGAPPAPARAVWTWRETPGRMSLHAPSAVYGDPAECWIRYDDAVGGALEAALAAGLGACDAGSGYSVDLAAMTQTNRATGYRRDVKRHAGPAAAPVAWCWRETPARRSLHPPSSFYGDPERCWIRYDGPAAARLEAAYRARGRRGECAPLAGYVVDLAAMKQRNLKTGYEREVLRAGGGDPPVGAGAVSAAPVPPVAAPVAAIATPVAASGAPAAAAATARAGVVPPPFLIPSGRDLSKVTIPESKDWKAPSKLAKNCPVVDPANYSKALETRQLRELSVPVHAAETVSFLYTKKGDKADDDGEATLARLVDQDALGTMKVKRTYRWALLTRGSLQLKKRKLNLKAMFVDRDTGAENVNFALHDLRGVRVHGAADAVVLLAYRASGRAAAGAPEALRFAVCQTPDALRLLAPLAEALVGAYAARPSWSIPVRWTGSGGASLPEPMARHRYGEVLGNDGGFSSAVYAAALAHCVGRKVPLGGTLAAGSGVGGRAAARRAPDPQKGRAAVARRVLDQQMPGGPPRSIDPVSLAEGLSPSGAAGAGDMREALVLAGLRALSFNLVFRRLELGGWKCSEKNKEAFRSALGQAMLYNVTLREVDFGGTDLKDMGETIGVAWAMNAQPLISRVNFSNCRLGAKDFRGLLQGFARIWCGGTALAESIRMANNRGVPAEAWDEFFAALVDPSAGRNWPRDPPPPPNLSFLQELDLTDTHAIGPGLLRLAPKLVGLRTLKLSSEGGDKTTGGVGVVDILLSLAKAGSRLERITGVGLDSSCVAALLAHAASLRELTLNRFRGDSSLLLCGWPEPVPDLSMVIGEGYIRSNNVSSDPPSGIGYSPGKLTILNSNNFGIDAMSILNSCTHENGLKKLTVHLHYLHLLATAPVSSRLETLVHNLKLLAAAPVLSRLEALVVLPETSDIATTLSMQRNLGVSKMEGFWATLAQSKTLLELKIPNQLIGGANSDDLAMIGRFLKSNRSVRSIGFDSNILFLKVDDVKALRSAFYGNKKVTELVYPSKARHFTMQQVGEETKSLWNEVSLCKMEIKKLFKRAYSKHNRHWRNLPNKQKLPWVERIRVAKRKIGKIERDQKKIAELLDEIRACVQKNKMAQKVEIERKANERLVRREGQLENLGKKKIKFAADLVAKLNKAKLRGRQQKSAKLQVPRSAYYKSANMWPSNKPPKPNKRPHSYYSHYNDPYYARYHWWHHPTYHNHNTYYNYDDPSVYNRGNDDDPGSDANDAVMGGMYVDGGMMPESDDPWCNVDALVQQVGSDYSAVLSPEYLALLHEECSELGPDVVENISSTLDDGAAISSKLDEIGEKTNAPPEMLGQIVDGNGFDLAAMEDTLADIPDNGLGDISGEDDDVADADDVVDMYAGAGPHDLPDGGPSFGASRHAVLAGARRRARARKASRMMRRIRGDMNGRLRGYQKVDLIRRKPLGKKLPENAWPTNLVQSWIEETRRQQIKAIAECNLFDLPAASGQPGRLLNQFSPDNTYLSTKEIEVILVTQCSLDRLQNLKAQLVSWTGKASVAIYLKPSECKGDAQLLIASVIEEARKIVEGTCYGHVWFDVAITIVEGCMDDEPYPINYLRNVALLEARRQHLRLNASLDTSAVLLVDVDFRLSAHLFNALHSQYAAKRILREREVVVCPAFECVNESCAGSISGLKKLVAEGRAEGFHLSHFPQGHGPTQFEIFWEKSSKCIDGDVSELWREAYQIQHKNLFEPYIVMASADVPLYDERFQGYGLNKVSHLATVSSEKGGEFIVLPGVFLVAPAHERSESWAKRYGTRSEETSFNQLDLKGLYYHFTKNLESGGEPVISATTCSQHTFLLKEAKRLKNARNESNASPIYSSNDIERAVLSH